MKTAFCDLEKGLATCCPPEEKFKSTYDIFTVYVIKNDGKMKP